MSIKIHSINVNNNKTNLISNHNAVPFGNNSLPNDKVEISTKKKKLSTGTKVGLGLIAILIIVFGICKGKSLKSLCNKQINENNAIQESKNYIDRIDNIKENFSKIFNRDFTKDEANELALKYKQIFETEDNTEFMGKIFEQIRKDYNLPDIPYIIGETERLNYAEWNMFEGIKYNRDLVKYVKENGRNKFIEVDRLNVVKALAHEMKHATQDKIANQVDVHKNIIARIDREQRHNTEFWKNNLRRFNNNVEETRSNMEEALYNAIVPSFKTLEKLPENSPLYQKGLGYIEGCRNYITATENFEGYRNQLIEREAHEAGDLMEQIYRWLTNK